MTNSVINSLRKTYRELDYEGLRRILSGVENYLVLQWFEGLAEEVMLKDERVIDLGIRNSISELYRVFKKYQSSAFHSIKTSSPDINEDERMGLTKPLNMISEGELTTFSIKAVTSWGGIKAFKYYLPRIFELIKDGDSPYTIETLLDKLNIASWNEWPDIERVAINQYFEYLWLYTLVVDRSVFYADRFFGMILATKDPIKWLTIWYAYLDHESALYLFGEFLCSHATQLLGKRNPRICRLFFDELEDEMEVLSRVIVSFLEEENFIKRFEEAFFQASSKQVESVFSHACDLLNIFKK